MRARRSVRGRLKAPVGDGCTDRRTERRRVWARLPRPIGYFANIRGLREAPQPELELQQFPWLVPADVPLPQGVLGRPDGCC